MIISSYVLDTLPDTHDEVARALIGFTGVEIHGREGDKLIVTIEADSLEETYTLATALSNTDNVTTVNLIYCNFEDETLCD